MDNVAAFGPEEEFLVTTVKGMWNTWRRRVLPILIPVLLVVFVRGYVAHADVVPSGSMYPTIPATSSSHVSVILVNRLATEVGHIHRGEVVVFWAPDHPHLLYVKRVIGMPGDTVTVTAHAVYINGRKLNESNPDIARGNGTVLGTYHVPPGHYFMLGDNRPISDDSRLWTHKYVARSAIVGEADFVLYPLKNMGPISQATR